MDKIPSYKQHICLVSDQTLPNVLPALISEEKPEKVYLLTSSDMKEKKKHEHLKAIFARNNIATEVHDVKSLSYRDLEKDIDNFLCELNDREDISQVCFNLTCGTKLMGFASQVHCSGLGIPMFYIDTYNEIYIDLATKEEFPIPQVLTVRNILNCYGSSTKKNLNPEPNPEYKNSINYMLNLSNSERNTIKTLNLASTKAAQGLSFQFEKMFPALDKLLKELEKTGLISRNDKTIIFKDEDARRFCNGAWLEHHLENVLANLKNTNIINDYLCSQEIISMDNKNQQSTIDQKADNELDGIFAHKNNLYVVECKTAQMTDTMKTSNIIYKLDSLNNSVGGTFAKGVLVSYFEITADERKRAEDLNILVIDKKEEVTKLEKTLREYLTGKNK